jgi:hypothetical protein
MESNSGAFHHSARPGAAHESASSQAGSKCTFGGASIANTGILTLITIAIASRAAN